MGVEEELEAFIKKYDVQPRDMWVIPSSKDGARAIKHKKLERIAAQEGMVVESLKVLALNQVEKTAAMEAIVRKGDQRVITTGEASPSNCKNAYPLAMAEKRALDRAYLKLLAVYAEIYSDVEADDFVDPSAGEKGRLLPSSQFARNTADKIMQDIRNCNSVDMLEELWKAKKEEFKALPEKFAAPIRELYSEKVDELRDMEAA